jgi:hypothetical protein
MSKMKTSWTPAGVVLLGCLSIPTPVIAQPRVAPAAPQGSSATVALPKLELPSGRYGVGRVGHHWTDSKRPDRFADDAQAHRELMVYIWYPASRRAVGIRGTYFPGAKEIHAVPALQLRMCDEFGSHWPSVASNDGRSRCDSEALWPVAEMLQWVADCRKRLPSAGVCHAPRELTMLAGM